MATNLDNEIKAKREELKKKMGLQAKGEGFYKLNKVLMSGDDGSFTFTDLLSERQKGQKPEKQPIGQKFEGVILKMRWALTRFDEPSNTFFSSTEYDSKANDKVTIYPPKDSGSVEAMKAKYSLSTQRVIYMYYPARKEIVRFYVKASGLTGSKNPNKEQGLFEYLDEIAMQDSLPCEYITECKGVFRKGTNQDGTPNKRKDHFASCFSRGRQLTDSETAKMYELINEVDEHTKKAPTEEQPTPEQLEEEEMNKQFDEVVDNSKPEITPEDIPF